VCVATLIARARPNATPHKGETLIMESAHVLALAGNESWLRNIIAHRLAASSTPVRNIGVGSSTLFDVGTLVYVPTLVPSSRSGMRDVNLAAAAVTFAAAASSKVRRVVVVSRVGKQRDAADSYLGALALLERKALDASGNVTVIRMRWFGRSSARPLTEFLAIDSVVTRRLASPLDVKRHEISEFW
jgi:hypothetical protein